MKKNYFYSALVAVLLSGGMTCQNALAQAQRERPRKVSLLSRLMKQPVKPVVENQKLQRNETKRANIKLAPVAPNLLNEQPVGAATIDTLLMTKSIANINNIFNLNYAYEYDEFGYRRAENISNNKGGAISNRRYSYNIGIDNYWTTRTIEKKEKDQQWVPESKVERDINEKHQLVGMRTYQISPEFNNFVLSTEKEYDYEHRYYDEYSDTWYVGATVKEKSFDTNGKITYESTYRWSELLQNYVETERIGYSTDREGTSYVESKTITKESGDELITYTYYASSMSDEHELYLGKEIHDFYGLSSGSYYVDYGMNGHLNSSGGTFKRTVVDVPEKGAMTTTEYEIEWNADNTGVEECAISKEVRKGMDIEDNPNRGESFYKRVEKLQGSEWEVTDEIQGNWLNDVLVHKKETTSYYGEIEVTDSYTYMPEGENVSNKEAHYDEKSKIYYLASSEYPSKENGNKVVNYYTYYNLQNEVVKAVKTVANYDNSLGWDFADTPVFYIQSDNGEWKVMANCEFEHFENYYDHFYRYIYKLNEKGQVVSEKVLTLIDGKEYVVSTSTCKYTVGGYFYESIDYDLETNMDGSEFYRSTQEMKRISADEFIFTNLEYYGNSTEIDWGDRAHAVKDITYFEEYDAQKKDFVEKRVVVKPIVTVDENTGFVTTIKRELDKNRNIVNKEKSVFKATKEPFFRHEEIYKWNATDNKWEGQFYLENSDVTYKINIRPFSDPRIYDDTGLNLQDAEDEQMAIDHEISRNSIEYSWDLATDTWQPLSIRKRELISHIGNTYIEKTTRSNSRETQEITREYQLDDEGYALVSKSDTKLTQDGKVTTRSEKVVREHNECGLLTKERGERVNEEGNMSFTDIEFIYEARQLVPTKINNVKGEEVFTVKGREVVAPAGALIEVYDLGGRKLMSAKGQLTLPAAGIYVVKSAGTSVKVSCR